MTIEMSQFYQVFFDEAEELLAEMERLLLAIDLKAPDAEELNAVFRTAHSIKGGASTFGLLDLTEVTHVLESLLDKIRNGDMTLVSKHVDAFLKAKDVLKMQLDGHRFAQPVDSLAVAESRQLLESFLPGSGVVGALTVSKPNRQSSNAKRITTFQIELPVLPAEELHSLVSEMALAGKMSHTINENGSANVLLSTSENLESVLDTCAFILNPEQISIKVLHSETEGAKSQKEIEEEQGYGFFDPLPVIESPIPRFGRESNEADGQEHSSHQDCAEADKNGKQIAKHEADKHHANHESTSIRVSIEKVDQLINLVGELVITQAMIEQRTGLLDPILNEKLLNSVSQLTRNTRDLQESVMSVRMMPMDYVFSRFPRMVRDLAAKLGKQVEFITHGAATELDKGLIERIVDPLTHLVRNSVDHGIETPEIREKSGKHAIGKLTLSASHQGGNIIIEVSDDGGGLNRGKIVAKALSKGIPILENASDGEIWQLIFAPGFSTADHVTDVSGRGVGMDVVKRNIAAMGGVVDVRSSKGYGTTISISLPLTLAILDGMSIKVGNETYILPLGYVIESLQPVAADLKEISGRGVVIRVRGEYLPLIPLHQIFNLPSSFENPSDGIVVIVESDGKKAALLLDEVMGQQQIVVKNLESNYRKVAGISGATILGDGGVSLIIDVAALLRSSRQLTDENIFS